MATLAQLLEMPEAPQLQTKFVVSLPEELAVSLNEWFKKAGKLDGDVDKFAGEVLECALADYRLEHLPPSEEESDWEQKKRLSTAEQLEICELWEDEGLSVVELAQRFRVTRSTIRRTLAAREAETGVAMRRKPPLDQTQLDEIPRLNDEGSSVEDLMKRFNRTRSRILQILRQHNR